MGDKKRSKSNFDNQEEKNETGLMKEEKREKKKNDYQQEVKLEEDQQNFHNEEENKQDEKGLDMKIEIKNSALEETMRESQRLLRELQKEEGKRLHSKPEIPSTTDHQSSNKS